ncbi:MAG: hypothetical protein IKP36_08675 [Bacteroidaceae bacterium]|nr:hypothetical protein [Bacteroidaceae bacterium]
MNRFTIHNITNKSLPLSGVGKGLVLLCLLLVSYPTFAKEKKEKKPKLEKLSTLLKNAKTAIKEQKDQDAARKALLEALSRPDLKTKQKADIYFTTALLDESLNSVENQKAYLKQPYDTAKFFNKLCDMFGQLRLCDSTDLIPDAKGRVHARFQQKTQDLRLKHRRNIYGGGKFYLAKKDYATAYTYFDLYCTYKGKRTKNKGKEEADEFFPHSALWATLSAFEVDNFPGTIKHADAAIFYADSATAAILQEYKVRSFAKLNNDSAWVASLKQGVLDYPEHDYFFVQLADWYHGQRNFAEEEHLADTLIAITGGKAIHYYAKSKCYLSEEKYEACIACSDSTIALQEDFADAYYNKGIAYLNMAVISHELSEKDVKSPQYAIDKQKTQELYRKARPCMEMVRRLQPEKQDRWASPLYRIYLNLNLGDEFVEIDRLLNTRPSK